MLHFFIIYCAYLMQGGSDAVDAFADVIFVLHVKHFSD